jgi:hypothetical protein
MARSEPKPSARSRPAKTPKTKSKRNGGPVSAVRSGKTKHDRILGMLHTRNGATIAAMARATGWQAHSVRGFLAGVVEEEAEADHSERAGREQAAQIAIALFADTAVAASDLYH